jgi:hypothetical protein
MATSPSWTESPATQPPSDASPVSSRLRGMPLPLWRRVPSLHDASRWCDHAIGERTWRVAQPVTFTPYASARPCSARCRFCSETLRTHVGGTSPDTLRPGADYFAALRDALSQLRGLPLSYSLSGLESTDDPDWFLRMLDTLDAASSDGVEVDERVLYSNGAGFAHEGGERLIDALSAFGLSWLELSRHHHDAEANQRIMRFRPQEPIAGNDRFEQIARALAHRLPTRWVCIVQQGGIADADAVRTYLRWAARHGAGTVIFREFSRLGDGYRDTGSRRYIEANRVSIESLIEACMASPLWSEFTPTQITEGYYFWNLRLRHSSGMEVVFESSDYTAMHERHASGDIYKLVFHANGRLCAGWSPDRDVLWDAGHG